MSDESAMIGRAALLAHLDMRSQRYEAKAAA